ncbi:MAG: class I SAM-dependent methyltransferase [Bacteroidota bacterium]
MQYDPIKRGLGNVFNRTPFLRKLFYSLLDLLLLRAWHVHRELKHWLRNAPSDASILDAGAGYGQYSFWLSRRLPKSRILAVDVKEEQVADCNRFFSALGMGERVRFAVEDLTRYRNPAQFDLALSVDVMEHILEDVEVFKNIHASLKPGGLLIISTPSDQGGSDVHDEGEGSFIEEHVRDGYNIREIEDKLRSAGFSEVHVRYQYGAPGKISWRLSMKYPILMLGATKLFYLILPLYYLIVYPFCALLNALDVSMTHPTGTGLIVNARK